MRRDFGVIGIDWHLHANGIDFSKIRDRHYVQSPSIGKSQILMRDYTFKEIYVVILEHVDEVVHRLRMMNKRARTVQFSISTKDGHTYRKQFTIDTGTHNENIVMEGIWTRFVEIADPNELYRTISVGLTNFIPDTLHQYSLFDDYEKLEKEESLMRTIDHLKVKYGMLSVMRALSMTEASTLKLREGLIAGHKR